MRERGGNARLRAAMIAAILGVAPVATARDPHLRLDAGPKAGVSINGDQWVLGGFARLRGLCPILCLGDLGVGFHALAGLGGNRVTLRTGLRVDTSLWLDDSHTVAFYPAVGGSAYILVPAGHFKEFCERTHLGGCGGTYFGLELGGGVRLWPFFVEALVGTGELPVVTVTGGIVLPVWERRP
jgi:hypothetical protein